MPAVDFLPRSLYKAFDQVAWHGDALKGLIALQGNPSMVSVFDDFTGTRSGTWPAGTPYAATVGTGTEVIGITQAVGGTMTLTTGTGGSDTAGQGYGLNWSGDRGFYFVARAKVSTITNSKIEIGMTDAVTDDGAVDTKSTPTFNATDCGLFVMDRTEDAELTFVSNGGASDANADLTSFDIAADQYFVVEVVGSGPTDTTGDIVTGFINGQQVGSGNLGGDAPLTPWFYIQDLAQSAAIILTVDYWGCVGPRVAQWNVSS
jgi:hypothetical protein